jgi:hypothetical protein
MGGTLGADRFDLGNVAGRPAMPIKICVRRAGACLNTDCSASFLVGRMTDGMITATSDGRCRSKSAAA